MRLSFLILALALSTSCKKGPQPTMPAVTGSTPMSGGGTVDLPDATLFHNIYRFAGHANQVHAFYAPEMEKRGATRAGDVWSDGNVEHTGDFGSGGTASAKDPSRPGIWVAVEEIPDETRIDVWESVPKAH